MANNGFSDGFRGDTFIIEEGEDGFGIFGGFEALEAVRNPNGFLLGESEEVDQEIDGGGFIGGRGVSGETWSETSAEDEDGVESAEHDLCLRDRYVALPGRTRRKEREALKIYRGPKDQ